MDDIDRQLLMFLEKTIPLQRRPFAAIGKKIGIDGAEVLLRINHLKQENIIRQISAVFDTKSLGYKSSLVAMRFATEKLEDGAAAISRHPGVSQNYQRSHEFNLWFTLAVPPQDFLEAHAQKLSQLAGAEQTLLLPALRLYKIGDRRDHENRRSRQAPGLTLFEIEMIRILQEDLPLTDEPFLKIARMLSVSEEMVFKTVQSFSARGYLRRLAATAHPQKTGFPENIIFAWRIPDEKVEEIGNQVALFEEVTHCCKRPTYTEIPYSLYAMVQGRDAADCEDAARRIEEKIGKWPRLTLAGLKEYKKIRLKYFTKELDEWWNEEALIDSTPPFADTLKT